MTMIERTEVPRLRRNPSSPSPRQSASSTSVGRGTFRCPLRCRPTRWNSAAFTYYSNAPTPGAVMAAVDGDGAMNVASGFLGQLSFYYSATQDTSVNVYSGLNGTGDLLGTINLAANATPANGCTADIAFCFWSTATFDFAGLAKSVQFGSTAGVAGFDNVTINAVPLPAAGWLLLSALGGFGALRRKFAA